MIDLTVTAPAGDRSHDRRTLALVVLCAGMLMIILDQTITNVALPSIRRDLGFSPSGLAWVVNAYLVTFGGLLLLAGRLGDLVGRTRVFAAGLSLFTAASLACGLSTSSGMLVAARFVQGAGGAVTSAVILGMIVSLFPEPGEQGRAIGVYSFVAAGGAAVGLLAGGVLTQALSWHWIFFVNVPIGLATLVASRVVLFPERGPGLRAGADVAGGVLVTAGLMLTVTAIVGAAEHGWASGRTLGLGAVSLLLLAGFVARQARAAHPLLPLRLFRSRAVTGANVVQMFMVAGMFGFLFVGTLYMQEVLRYDEIETGLAIVPVALGIGALSLGPSPRLVARFGARAVLLPGLALIVAGLALLARAPADAVYAVDLLPVTLLLGVGAGLVLPALMTLAMSGATPADSGLASGLVNTTQQVGGALGLAVLATLSSSRSDALAAEGEGRVDALLGGYHLAFGAAAASVVVAIALAVAVLRPVGAAAPTGAAEEPDLTSEAAAA
jgi:EmrB/QacA subfamily drug resistance transporter